MARVATTRSAPEMATTPSSVERETTCSKARPAATPPPSPAPRVSPSIWKQRSKSETATPRQWSSQKPYRSSRRLSKTPEGTLRLIFNWFQLQVRYDKRSNTAHVRVSISENTLNKVLIEGTSVLGTEPHSTDLRIRRAAWQSSGVRGSRHSHWSSVRTSPRLTRSFSAISAGNVMVAFAFGACEPRMRGSCSGTSASASRNSRESVA